MLYTESLLRHLSPLLRLHKVNAGMFADDLTIWKSGPAVRDLDAPINLVVDAIAQWAAKTNMVLAEAKCETILFSNFPGDPAPQISVQGFSTPVKDVVRLLGVYLDKTLTFKPHVDYLISKTAKRIHQLKAVANSTFGPSQADLRNMYTSYIRSLVDYGALSWLPGVSLSNIARLEVIQNKAARVAVGVPSATDVPSLLLEASLLPLHIRLKAQIATGAERYRRFPAQDPLYMLSHAPPPQQRLQAAAGRTHSWQTHSETILRENGFEPGRRGTLNLHFGRLSLQSRVPLSFAAAFPPHQLPDLTNVDFHCAIPGITKQSSDAERAETTLDALAGLGFQDYEFWTDASVEHNRGAAAALLYRNQRPREASLPPSPKRHRASAPELLASLAAPAGLLTASCPAELIGLRTALDYIAGHEDVFCNRRVLLATDSQASLKALASGPLRHINEAYVPLWQAIAAASRVVAHLDFHFVFSHCGVPRNEAADEAAKTALHGFDVTAQAGVPITVPSLQSALLQRVRDTWLSSLRPEHIRMHEVGCTFSKLPKRATVPRVVQCTFSQWRCGENPTLGPYPRRLGRLPDPTCRWCQGPPETIPHLLEACPAVAHYRAAHSLSRETLKDDTPDGANKIYKFQEYLLATLPDRARRRRGEDPDDPAPPARRAPHPGRSVAQGSVGAPEPDGLGHASTSVFPRADLNGQ